MTLCHNSTLNHSRLPLFPFPDLIPLPVDTGMRLNFAIVACADDHNPPLVALEASARVQSQTTGLGTPECPSESDLFVNGFAPLPEDLGAVCTPCMPCASHHANRVMTPHNIWQGCLAWMLAPAFGWHGQNCQPTSKQWQASSKLSGACQCGVACACAT